MTTRHRKNAGSLATSKGPRLDFLTSKIPEYIEASKKKYGKEAKTEGLAPFWTNLFKEYWKLFPWDLPLDQDPVPNAPPPPPDLEPQTAEEALEQAERKSQVQKKIKEKIKRWSLESGRGAIGIHGNPYFAWLARLRRDDVAEAPNAPQISASTCVTRISKSTVMERFEEEYGEDRRKMHVSLRCQVAREMLEAEREEVKSRIKRECDEVSHAKEPSNASVVRRFLSIVQPLLAGLHAYTGLTLNIIGGRINEETQKFETMSANSGLVGGKDWACWDPEGYSAMLKTYLKFDSCRVFGSRRPPPLTAAPAAPVGPVPPPPDVFLGMNLLRMSEQDDVNEKAADGAVLRDGEGDSGDGRTAAAAGRRRGPALSHRAWRFQPRCRLSAVSNPAPVPYPTAVSNPTTVSDPSTAAATWALRR
ncbi:hypothetical protein B0H14DRAFT_3462539 [Mycena olivaceomarginata]|nr:hypothetical protein B0H14DRAFT_3462539 [Mycena olivaceomarginata]